MTAWTLPSPLLIDADPAPEGAPEEDRSDMLRSALSRARVEVEEVTRHDGPQAVRYLLTLAPGANPARIKREEDTLSLAVGTAVRYAGVEGRQVVLEVARESRRFLGLAHFPVQRRGYVPVGETMDGRHLSVPLATLPHMIVAGTTGSGKSEYINALLTSALLAHTPDQLRLVLIDPKRVELAAYSGLPHLDRPVVTDAVAAVEALRDLVATMDARYEVFAAAGTKTLVEYNSRPDVDPLPLVLCVIDELADLMATSASRVESYLIRLGQLARAAGIHLVLATQRPAADVLTKKITSNIPSRVGFRTQSYVESKIILGYSGTERLLGRGDGLFVSPGESLTRFQGPRVTADEVALITRAWRAQHAQHRPAQPVKESAKARAERERAAERAKMLDDNTHEGDTPSWDYPIEDDSPDLGADFLLEEAGLSAEVVDALASKVLERLSGPALAEMIAANLAALLDDEEKRS